MIQIFLLRFKGNSPLQTFTDNGVSNKFLSATKNPTIQIGNIYLSETAKLKYEDER